MRQAHPEGEASEAHTLSSRGTARPCRLVPTPLEVAVGEAVFRYQLQQPLADAPQPSHSYLALQGRDPQAAILYRLQRLGRAVHPFSHCRVTARDGVVDRTTGARGVILQVARFSWPHATAADVVGGYYLTHRQAASFRYHLEPHDGRWAVTAAHLLWRV
jgi:hypothetical protein